MKSHKFLALGLGVTLLILILAVVIYMLFVRSPQLVFQTIPAGARTSVDSRPVAQNAVSIDPGSHVVTVAAEGYVTYQKTLTLKRAQRLVLPILLKPIPKPNLLSSQVSSTESFVKSSQVYFLGNNGRTIYRTISTPGQVAVRIEALTPDSLDGIQKLIWRPDTDVVFLKKSDGIYLYDFMRHDLLHQTQTLWGAGIDQIAWSPDGRRVAYTYFGAGGEESLKFADVQNKNQTIVANLTEENITHPTLAWSPNGEAILLVAQSAQKKTNYVYTLDIFSKKISQLTEAGEVGGAIWSPDSTQIAYIAPGRDQEGQTTAQLWVAKADGSGVRPLNLSVPRISKVAWASDSTGLVVATPASGGQEQLIHITLEGTVTPYQYTQPTGPFAPDYLAVVAGDDRLLFNIDGQLYSLALITSRYE